MTQTLVSESDPKLKTGGRVAFLINKKETDLFFPLGFSLPDSEIFDLAHATRGGCVELDALREIAPEVVIASWSTARFPENTMSELPSLRYICHTSGSIRYQVPRVLIEQGLLVTNWGNLAASAVAEHALLLILSSLRRSAEWPSVICGERAWQPSPIRTRTLYGKSVGIHGFGNVARALVQLLRPFTTRISAYSEGVPSAHFDGHAVRRCDSLEELFSSNMIVVDCEALNSTTKGSVTRDILECLPDSGLFVNVGRGAVVDEHAIADLVSSGRLFAALDVFSTDPIAPDSPLHKLEGVVLSPHIAGPTSDQFVHCGELALRNVAAFFQDRPLSGEVTLEIYDRST